jgi:hypothetical protein
MGVEDKLDKLAEVTHTFHGEVRQFMTNQTAYIGAVNNKLNTHISEHREDERDKNKIGLEKIAIGITVLLSLVSIGAEAMFHIVGGK